MSVTTILNDLTFFEQDITLNELFVKLINGDTIITYRIHMNRNRISHLCYKNVQEVYIELQNVQKMLHYLGTDDAPLP